jgi:hypothetical protein
LSLDEQIRDLEEDWQKIASVYLPVDPNPGAPWCFSRGARADDAAQGWKLHVSATILSAKDVLHAIGPLLAADDLLFKGPRALRDLQSMNIGLFSAFTQVGKFVTVYPRTASESVSLANRLCSATSGFPGPAVPFEQAVRPDRNVFYRYGAFLQQADPDGVWDAIIRDPDGSAVEDRRDSWPPFPPWVKSPFPKIDGEKARWQADSPLATQVLVFEALSQRGKGGVYKALDLSVSPPRLCVVKEGRRHGETEWDGRDGAWRARHEGIVLTNLSSASISVPKPYLRWAENGHEYLTCEWIDGRDLQSLLLGSRKRLDLRLALDLGLHAARLLSAIHSAGWAWRDCKPKNFILSNTGTLYACDFEGACRPGERQETPWGTPGYTPSDDRLAPSGEWLADDLFALGVTLHQLLTSRIVLPGEKLRPVGTYRRGIPRQVRAMVDALISKASDGRPGLAQVTATLLEGRDEVTPRN